MHYGVWLLVFMEQMLETLQVALAYIDFQKPM